MIIEEPCSWCNATKAVTDPPEPGKVYSCTLRKGHQGNHIAHVGGFGSVVGPDAIVQEWPQEKELVN